MHYTPSLLSLHLFTMHITQSYIPLLLRRRCYREVTCTRVALIVLISITHTRPSSSSVMAIISVGVVNKQGRILLARQFADISRIRVEGLLSAFPRLLESSVGRQVTYIDAGTVRYVYQHLQEMYLVLITTKNSNIVEDLATLHLMGRLIAESIPPGFTDAALEESAFLIFFALDEIVVGGKRDISTVEGIQTCLKMQSAEEDRENERKQQQLEQAKRITNEKAKELREKRRAAAFGNGPSPYEGIGSDDLYRTGGAMESRNMSRFVDNRSAYGNVQPQQTASVPASDITPRIGGMSLSKARKVDITSKVQKEMGGAGANTPTPLQRPAPAVLEPTPLARESVHVTVDEKFTGAVGREGDVRHIDVKGELSVLVSDPQHDQIKLKLAPVCDGFQFRAHAKVNKALFAGDHVLAMVDNKPFPVQQPVTILRWRLHAPGSITAPISFTCWPETGSIVVEYELSHAATPPLEPVVLTLPLYGAAVAEVAPSTGIYAIQGDSIVWTIPVVDGSRNTSGNIEVHLADADQSAAENVFFPIEVSFSSAVSIGMVRVDEVISTTNAMRVPFSQDTHLITDSFTIN